MARYVVRMAEMRESLEDHPAGAGQAARWARYERQPQVRAAAALRTGHEHGSADPSLQVVDGGFQCAAASVYSAVESPRGELGVYLEGDGGPKPHRVFWRTPSFENLSVISVITKGHLVADLIAILASVDIVLGDIDR